MSGTTAEEQILAARERLNRAIAERDLAVIAAYLLPTYDVVTARSLHRHGGEASTKSWGELFAHDQHAVHSRSPREIYVNEAWGMAEEHGRWTSTVSAAQGLMEAAGVYAAKWHFSDGGWRLEAEIFTPLSFEPVSLPTTLK